MFSCFGYPHTWGWIGSVLMFWLPTNTGVGNPGSLFHLATHNMFWLPTNTGVGSNPIRVMWDFSALAGSYPELGVLWAQWEVWNHTAELHPLHGCVFEGVALII